MKYKLLIGERYKPRLKPGLDALNMEVVWLPDNPDIDIRLAGHADLSAAVPEPATIVAARGVYPCIVNKITNKGHRVIRSSPQNAVYPGMAGLCICVVGQYTIYNKKTIDPVLAACLTGTHIHVTQGFTACSVCVVSDKAIITADDVIARRASDAGLDVLHIAPGMIELDGFDTGFIGGASFLIDDTVLAFTGSLDAHTDKDKIMGFLAKHGIKPFFLTKDPIFDVGGAVRLP